MIVARSPLRITLGGGGTDLPFYYQEHSGFLIAAAIDKYVYIALNKTFARELVIKHFRMERVSSIDEVEHPIIREALRYVNLPDLSLEITSMADLPAGAGLGSSGSFTTALLKALHTLKKDLVHPQQLAEEACYVEMELLKEPIGKQDQYISAYGGITCFEFRPGGEVKASPLQISTETLYNLEDNLLLFFTGYTRLASSIIIEQTKVIDNLHFVKELGYKSKVALESGNLHEFAHLMNVHWEYKKKRSKNMSNTQIDDWYHLALKNGALGGKLVGAGGGGFLMFYTEEKTRLRQVMGSAGLQEVRFRFDFAGTQVVAES